MMGFGLIWILVLVGLIAYVMRWRPEFLEPRRTPEETKKTPLEILKERYARGEITREQYEEMRRDLESINP